MSNFLPWEATTTITKAYQDKSGKMHVVAVASDDGIDLQRDQMSSLALDKMAQQVSSGIPLLDNHKSTFEFGRTIGGQITTKDVDGSPIRQLVVDVELNADYPQSRQLFKDVKAGNCDKQLSIGGKLNLKNSEAITVQMTSKGLVRKINDVELDHIACTRYKQAANPRTGFVHAILKSVDDADMWSKFTKEDAEEDDTSTTETTESVISDTDVEKDAKAGLGLLSAIGKILRRNGGAEMKRKLNKEGLPEGDTWPMDDGAIANEEDDSSAGFDEDIGDGMGEEVSLEAGLDDVMEDPDAGLGDDIVADGGEDQMAPITEEELELSVEGDDEMPEEIDLDAEEFAEDDDDFGFSPEEEIAAKTLMAARRRRMIKEQEAEESESEEVIIRDISFLLGAKAKISKRLRGKRGYNAEKQVIKAALHNIRYLLSKQIQKSNIGGVVAEMAQQVVGEGTFAPNSESAAGPNKIDDDTATGDAGFGTNSVTDSRTMADPRSKPVIDAPKGSSIASQASATVSSVSGLPQSDDTAEFGKSMDAFFEKSMKATGNMILKSVDKIVKSQNESLGQISKALSSMEQRISKVERAGGVRHSGPRGNDDTVIKSKKGDTGNFNGMFMGAANQATRRM